VNIPPERLEFVGSVFQNFATFLENPGKSATEIINLRHPPLHPFRFWRTSPSGSCPFSSRKPTGADFGRIFLENPGKSAWNPLNSLGRVFKIF
jgi:hypothetical protein